MPSCSWGCRFVCGSRKGVTTAVVQCSLDRVEGMFLCDTPHIPGLGHRLTGSSSASPTRRETSAKHGASSKCWCALHTVFCRAAREGSVKTFFTYPSPFVAKKSEKPPASYLAFLRPPQGCAVRRGLLLRAWCTKLSRTSFS